MDVHEPRDSIKRTYDTVTSSLDHTHTHNHAPQWLSTTEHACVGVCVYMIRGSWIPRVWFQLIPPLVNVLWHYVCVCVFMCEYIYMQVWVWLKRWVETPFAPVCVCVCVCVSVNKVGQLHETPASNEICPLSMRWWHDRWPQRSVTPGCDRSEVGYLLLL